MFVDSSATFNDAGQIPLVCQDGMEGGGEGLSEKVDGRRVGPLPEPGLAGAALVEGLHLGQTSLRHRLNQVSREKKLFQQARNSSDGEFAMVWVAKKV